MADRTTPYTLDRVVRMVLSAAVLVAVFFLLRYLSDVLLPFAAAVVLAYLLNPLVTLFERRTQRRGVAVAVTLFGLAAMGLALVVLIVPLMLGQVDRFRNDVGKLADDLGTSIAASAQAADAASQKAPADTAPSETTDVTADKEAPATSALGWSELTEAWKEYRRDAGTQSRRERFAELRQKVADTYIGRALEEAIVYVRSNDFRDLLVNTAKRLVVGGWSVFTFFVNVVLGLTGLIIVLVYLVFLLMDFPEYARTWPSFLPPQYRDATVDFLAQFDAAMRCYFRGQAVVALLTGALMAVGFTLIGLPMAVPFGLFVGLLAMVPYLPTVTLVPGVMLAGLRAIEGDASFLGSVLLLLAVYAVVQVIQDTQITPRVMGKATGLRPVAILLGVFVWGKLLGFLGLILAIPLTCLGIAYYRRYVLLYKPTTK
jgi:predicted PurR-regulated permease PerM